MHVSEFSQAIWIRSIHSQLEEFSKQTRIRFCRRSLTKQFFKQVHTLTHFVSFHFIPCFFFRFLTFLLFSEIYAILFLDHNKFLRTFYFLKRGSFTFVFDKISLEEIYCRSIFYVQCLSVAYDL